MTPATSSDSTLPPTTLELEEAAGVLHVFLNRPASRNALDGTMVEELARLATSLVDRHEVRCVVLRGRGGFFSAGADLQSLKASLPRGDAGRQVAAVAEGHRRFGALLEQWEHLPQALVAVVEGAALGGGLGLLTVADVVLARSDARLGLPEARLGLVPAQVAPFVVRRIGLAASRRLLVTGRPIDGRQGALIGLVDTCCEADADLEAALAKTLRDVLRCGPQAIAAGKALLQAAVTKTRERRAVLDDGARIFAERLDSDEGREGVDAFLQGRAPGWAVEM